MMSLEQYEHQKMINQRTQQEAYNWRQPQQPQKFVQIEDSSLLHLQERQDTQEQQLLQQQPVMWDRGKKKPEQVQHKPEPQVPTVPFDEKPKTYEEMHDELIEPVPVQQPEQVPVLWERGKKKTVQPQPKTFEELHDVLDETVIPQQPEQVPVLWERGKKKPITQEVTTVEETLQTSQVVEETKKTAVRRVIPPREPEQKVEQVTLKPTPRQRPKETQKAEEFQLKPLKITKSVQQSVEETALKAFEETTDELVEDAPTQQEEQPQPVMWERGKKKKPQQPEEQVSEIPKTLEVAVDTLEEATVKAEEPQPQPVMWERGKKKPQQPAAQETPKSLEVTVDTIEDETLPTTQPEPQPVLWERGKKKSRSHSKLSSKRLRKLQQRLMKKPWMFFPKKLRLKKNQHLFFGNVVRRRYHNLSRLKNSIQMK